MITRRRVMKAGALGSAALLAGHSPLLAKALAVAYDTEPTSQPGRLRFGANFTPRKRWWYCWLDWDRQAIADDLSGIAALGLDHIRIQCLWPYFQPGISTVSDRALANLHTLLDAADVAGLDVEVTVLNGWMSGLSFLPAWTMPLQRPVQGDDRNIFTSRAVIEAEKLLFRRIAETIGRHPRFLGFDIGNELGVLQSINNPVSTAAADAWATEMLLYCEQIAPGKIHVNGADDSHWFNDVGFSRPMLASTGSATVMHAYIYFTGVLERYPYSGTGSLHLADYMIELGAAYSIDPARQVWIEEIGVGNKEMPEGYKPEFMEHTVRNIAATGKAWGITWWCSHDIEPSIKDFNDYEYGLGLLDLNNKPKPMGKKFAQLAAELRQPQEVLPRPVALVIPDSGLSTKPWPADWKFATPYMKLIDQGALPAIVLASRAKDEDYLRARGITQLVPLSSETGRNSA